MAHPPYADVACSRRCGNEQGRSDAFIPHMVDQRKQEVRGAHNARRLPHSFGRILLSQSVCTVVGIVLQPCDAMDGKDRGTLGTSLSQEMGMMQQAFAYPFMYWVGMNTPPDTDP